MEDLTAADFAVGDAFEIVFTDGSLGLTVDLVQPIPHAPRQAGGFRIEFIGPASPLLPQATYPLSRGGEIREIFIVPVARDSSATRYEAIFN